MRVGVAQTDIVWNYLEANLTTCRRMVGEARGADLLVFPEMFTSGFSLLTGGEAKETALGTRAWLEGEARRSGIALTGSFPWSTDPSYANPLNHCVVAGPQGTLAEYSKVHLFNFGSEGQQYQPGNNTVVFRHAGFRIAPLICYDLRFPVPFSRLAPQVDLFVVMANWPVTRQAHWRALLIARALENQAYVVGVNRVGEGGGLRYEGGSLVVAPDGEILAELGAEAELRVVELDAARAARYRETFPVLKDRRPIDA